jgi:Pvc16 N-terminal domain
MSDYKVVSAVDETLRALLWTHMQNDSEIISILPTEQQIKLDPPFLLMDNDKPTEDALSLFLYRVTENTDLKNRLPEQVSATHLRYPPLCLNLLYLITPLTKLSGNDHHLLTKAMQIFYDHAILKGSELQGVLQGSAEELRLALHSLSMEDISKIWSAFMRPMRLSVAYEVKVVYVDSERETAGAQVRRKHIEYAQIN